ncbi:DUF4062 domain-containing protein [Tsuneonella sp. HG249]
MADLRSVIRVFLASPSDLTDERKAAKRVCDEANLNLANPFGYHVDLVGWEETVTGFGRPQELINKDLDQCDRFFGVLWKRWGTKPGPDSPYESGFEEEFRRTVARREGGQNVQIGLFLKEIDQDSLKDPGDQLKKVVAFRDELNADQRVYYETFADPRDFEDKFRRALYKSVRDQIQADHVETNTKTQAPETEPSDQATAEPATHGVAAEISAHFRYLMSATKDRDPNSPLLSDEIARLRLFALSFSSTSNDEAFLQAHDANLIYRHTSASDLAIREKYTLLRSALYGFSAENIPLWQWKRELDANNLGILPLYSAVKDPPQVRINALRAMTFIGEPIEAGFLLGREATIDGWFADTSPELRNVALRYLAEVGEPSDADFIESEIARADHQTLAAAIDAAVILMSRTNRSKAIERMFELDPATPSERMIDLVRGSLLELSVADIRRGLDVKSDVLRAVFAEEANRRKLIDEPMARQLAQDSNAIVRHIAARALVNLRSITDLTEAKSVIVKPRQQTPGLVVGLLNLGSHDSQGQKQYEEFVRNSLRNLDLAELRERAANSNALNYDAVFALAEREFQRSRNEIVSHISDGFEQVFESYLSTFGESPEASKIRERWKGLRQDVCVELVRHALLVLIRAGREGEISTIRFGLDKFDIKWNTEIVEYLSKFGGVEDVARLTKLLNNLDYSETTILGAMTDNRRNRLAGSAIARLIRGDISQLPLEVKGAILAHTIAALPAKSISQLDTDRLNSLLNDESEFVRKFTALRCAAVLTKKRLGELLDRQLKPEETYYYNTVHWLDFGFSMKQSNVAPAVRRFFGGL